MSLGLVVSEEKSLTRTRTYTPQSDAICQLTDKSADITKLSKCDSFQVTSQIFFRFLTPQTIILTPSLKIAISRLILTPGLQKKIVW